MARKNREELTVGEDAFLDTIANLVGILIILVVIVSVGTRSAAQLISVERVNQAAKDLEKPVESARNIESDFIRQVQQSQRHAIEVAYRKAERDVILQKVLLAKEAVDSEAEKLSDQQREKIDQELKLNAMEKALAELLQQQGEVANQEKPTIALQHLPTPMAKTVFGKEMHLMLKNNLVSVVPFDRLVALLKSEARNAISRSTRRDVITDRIGPVDGFYMDYWLVAKRGLVSNGGSTAMAHMVELDKFELDPTLEVIREPIEQALNVGGRLRVELASYIPRETTVTVWVYPDSFDTFRRLKEALFVEGYMTAARPLPEGLKISASPRGSQSSAQ